MSYSIRNCILPVLGAALLLTAAASPGQSPAERQIIMPLELVAGEPATLAVLGLDGRVQAGVQVSLSDGESLTTDETGRAHFLAPAEQGILFAQIRSTQHLCAADVRRHEGADDLKIEFVPRIDSLDGKLKIRGFGFTGDADKNQVELNGQRALVLAASANELVIAVPEFVQPGTANLDLRVGNQSASAKIVLVQVTATPSKLLPGKKKKITLHVLGTQDPVQIELRNLRSEVVQFPHDDYVQLRSSGGNDNSVQVQARGLRTGDFSYAVRLMPEAGMPDLPAARDFLQAAFVRAPQSQADVLANILKLLQEKNPNVAEARKEINQISTAGTSGEYRALLLAIREALLGHD